MKIYILIITVILFSSCFCVSNQEMSQKYLNEIEQKRKNHNDDIKKSGDYISFSDGERFTFDKDEQRKWETHSVDRKFISKYNSIIERESLFNIRGFEDVENPKEFQYDGNKFIFYFKDGTGVVFFKSKQLADFYNKNFEGDYNFFFLTLNNLAEIYSFSKGNGLFKNPYGILRTIPIYQGRVLTIVLNNGKIVAFEAD